MAEGGGFEFLEEGILVGRATGGNHVEVAGDEGSQCVSLVGIHADECVGILLVVEGSYDDVPGGRNRGQYGRWRIRYR